jgi:hypothetical protein
MRRADLALNSLKPAIILVEPMGFEPTTFPVSPGRAHQAIDEGSILL